MVGKIDSKTLEKAIVSTTEISNRKLRIDLAVIKKALEMGEVVEVRWVESEKQVADGRTRGSVGGNIFLQLERGKWVVKERLLYNLS